MSTAVTDMVSKEGIHDLVDAGQLFRQGHVYTIESGTSAYMLIRCGAKYPHMLFSAVADGDVIIELLGAPTVTDYGAEEPSGNFNFNSDRVSLTKWYITPTMTDEGVHIATTAIFGGSGVNPASGSKSTETMNDFDAVLIPDVDFLLKFTNTAGRDIQFLFEAVYREGDRDSSQE